MYQISKDFLEYLENTIVSEDPEWDTSFPKPAYAFLARVYDKDIWDGSFREKINAICEKEISALSISEIHTYFTSIICIERHYHGYFQEHAENGVLISLLKRYIQLCDAETEEQQ